MAQADLTNEVEGIDDRLSNTQRHVFEEIIPRLQELEERVDELEAENQRLQERLKDTSDKNGKKAAIVEFAQNKREAGKPLVKVCAMDIKGATGVSRRYAYDLVDDLPDEEDWFLTPEEMDQYGSIQLDKNKQEKFLGVDFEGVHSAGVPVNKFTTDQARKEGK